MEVPVLIQEHPIATGAAVIGLIIFASMNSGGGNSGAAITLQSQKIASDTNIALSSITANQSNTRAGYTADMYKTGVNASASLAVDENKNLVDLYHTFMAHDATVLGINKQAEVAKYQTEAGATVALTQISADLQQTQLKAAAADTSLARIIGSSDYQFSAALAEKSADLPMILAHAEAIASINTAATRRTSEANADATDSQSDMNWVGTAFDVISSVMSWF